MARERKARRTIRLTKGTVTRWASAMSFKVATSPRSSGRRQSQARARARRVARVGHGVVGFVEIGRRHDAWPAVEAPDLERDDDADGG
jgi:hypothetical protein